jgi:hypothetical protein
MTAEKYRTVHRRGVENAENGLRELGGSAVNDLLLLSQRFGVEHITRLTGGEIHDVVDDDGVILLIAFARDIT